MQLLLMANLAWILEFLGPGVIFPLSQSFYFFLQRRRMFPGSLLETYQLRCSHVKVSCSIVQKVRTVVFDWHILIWHVSLVNISFLTISTHLIQQTGDTQLMYKKCARTWRENYRSNLGSFRVVRSGHWDAAFLWEESFRSSV